MMRASSWPPLVRWKKPSGKVWRWRNRRTRRSRTTPSSIATLLIAAPYAAAFLITNAISSTRTTLRSAVSGAPAVSRGPAIFPSTASTLETPVAGSACWPNNARRNGISSTNVAPSMSDATSVAAMLTAKRNL